MSLLAQVQLRRAGFELEVDLTVADAEVVAVLGPNGAGKTTLLRALAGLLPLTAGRVELAGRCLEDVSAGRRLPAHLRGIGVVFQDHRLFPHLSARENVGFGLRSTGSAKAAARATADAWLGRLGLAGFEDRRPRELSGGQAQRVALARALCTGPDLLLLDEPLASLDVDTRTVVRSELQVRLQQFPAPTVLVTHDPLEALSLADRLVVLEDGRVVQQGTAAEVASRPLTSYVARLVGLNLLRGTANRGLVSVVGGGTLVTADLGLQGPCLAVVRPSSVVLQRSEPAGSTARNVWTGRLSSLQVIGDRVRVAVASIPPLLADVTTQSVAELRLGVGDLVWLSVKATDIDSYPDPGG